LLDAGDSGVVIDGDVVAAGPGSAPTANFMMVYGPRDEAELATVLGIVTASHAFATGA
jgi:hypothetical protein